MYVVVIYKSTDLELIDALGSKVAVITALESQEKKTRFLWNIPENKIDWVYPNTGVYRSSKGFLVVQKADTIHIDDKSYIQAGPEVWEEVIEERSYLEPNYFPQSLYRVKDMEILLNQGNYILKDTKLAGIN